MEIHIARDGVRLGPYSPEEVRRQLSAGTLRAGDLGWSEGLPAWVPLATFPGLSPPPIPGGATGAAIPPVLPHVPFGGPVVRYRVPATSAAAIASMVMGILSFTALPGIAGVVAIVCGHIARSDIRKSSGELGGDGMALSGLIMGYFNVCLIALLVLAILVPLIFLAGLKDSKFSIFDWAQKIEKIADSQALTNAREVAEACRQYAREHDDRFPETLEELVPQYLPERKSLTYPQTDPKATSAYTYFGGTLNAPPDKILFQSRPGHAARRQVQAHVDGSVNFEGTPRPSPRRTPLATPAAEGDAAGRGERSVTPAL